MYLLPFPYLTRSVLVFARMWYLSTTRYVFCEQVQRTHEHAAEVDGETKQIEICNNIQIS